ncbi:MAG: anti-sigma factor family protein [Solirubrobacterales bacterium]
MIWFSNVPLLRRLQFRLEHRFALARLSQFVDGDLADHQQERIDAHVDDCPECTAIVRQLRRMLRALGALGQSRGAATPAGERVARHVMGQIEMGGR